MTDERNPDPPDQRDDRIAELLEVPPLDDVTRRRLVTRALEAAADETDTGERTGATATAAPRGRRLLAAAAAVVAVVAIGAGVFSALRDDGGSGTTTVAGRADRRGADSGGAESQDKSAEAPESAPAPNVPTAGTAATPIELGDLGDVTDANRLRGVVQGGLSGGDRQAHQRLDAQTTTCLASLPAGTATVAVGTGRYQGAPVVVVVVAENLDRFRVSLLDPVTCAAKSELAV